MKTIGKDRFGKIIDKSYFPLLVLFSLITLIPVYILVKILVLVL